MGPLAGPAQTAASYVLAGEVGVLFGFLSHRVLGQYELALLDPTTKPRLLFVAPNIDAAVGKLEVDRREFLHWVALHEVTHGLQFAAVPWLRGYLAGQVRELIAGPRRVRRLPRGDEAARLVPDLRPRHRHAARRRPALGRDQPRSSGRSSTASRRPWRSSRATPSM